MEWWSQPQSVSLVAPVLGGVLVGALMGGVGGGVCVAAALQGRRRGAVRRFLACAAGVGVALVALGTVAWGLGQPAHVHEPLIERGALAGLMAAGLWICCRTVYEQRERNARATTPVGGGPVTPG